MWLSPRPWCCCLGDGPFYLRHGAFCWRCSTERTLSGRFVSPAAVQFLWFHRFVSKRHSPFAITFCMFVPRILFVFPVVDRQCLVLARQCRKKNHPFSLKLLPQHVPDFLPSNHIQGGFQAASRELQGVEAFRRWRGLRRGLKRAWRGLHLPKVSTGLEGGFKGVLRSLHRWRGLRGCLQGGFTSEVWACVKHVAKLWKYKWLGAIPMVRCGICAVSTLRMCFYACRISLISSLLNEDLICWVGSWNCRGYSVIGICFRIFTGGCKQFCTGELVFRNLEFVFAGATFECSFCRVSESFVRLCVYVWCHSKGWRNLVVPEGFPLLCLLGFECFDTLPRMMKVPTESL